MISIRVMSLGGTSTTNTTSSSSSSNWAPIVLIYSSVSVLARPSRPPNLKVPLIRLRLLLSLRSHQILQYSSGFKLHCGANYHF